MGRAATAGPYSSTGTLIHIGSFRFASSPMARLLLNLGSALSRVYKCILSKATYQSTEIYTFVPNIRCR